MRYLLSSLALVAPCFWLPRIQAGDLSSHLYNAWLAQLIGRGQAPGLSIRPQWTNLLFDLELSALWRLGPGPAHKLAAALAVLAFAWGAFALATAAARRRPWFLLPLIGVLAYGWVFHAGFFNFYLSLGLCCWALALAWNPGGRRIAAAIAVLGLAYVAHALPVIWAIGAAGYGWLARRLRPRHYPKLLASAVMLVLLIRWAIEWRFPTYWYPQQAMLATGTDQVWIYGLKYQILQAVLLALAALLVIRLWERGWKRIATSVPLQIGLVTAAAVALIPTRIQLPGYQHALVYIAERMSLAVAVCGCAALASARPRRGDRGLLAAFACAYAACLWIDGRGLNRLEDRIGEAVAQLPAGARVVSLLPAPDGRIDPVVHMIDRACIGHCFSYANYEPSTAQFRIRAAPGNPLVVADYGDSYAMQRRRYTVRESDLPLYAVVAAAGGVGVRSLQAAEGAGEATK